MGGGSPDYTKTTRIQGMFAGNLVTIAVDANGQLYALLKGYDGANYVPISVDADGQLVAVMTGSDGVSSLVLLTDAAGRMISVIQDPVSGYNVGVDINGFMTTVIKGMEGANLRTLTVDASGRLVGTLVDGTTGDPLSIDSDGFLTTVLKGLDDATLRTVKVDASGRMVATIVDATTGQTAAIDANGYLTSVMKGLEGANLRTIAVDINGNIVGVFKGEYSGALKTVATDVDGRIIAIMVDPLNLRGVRPVVGSGELAARLGSPVSFERRGTVMFIDDFSCGESKSLFESVGAGATACITATRSRTGGYSAKLTSGTGGGSYGRVYHATDLWQYTGLMGMETHLSTVDGTHLIQLELNIYDGANRHIFGIQWNQDDDGIKYLNSAGVWTASGMSIDASTTIPAFHAFKLVVDLDTDKYVRLYFGSNIYDMAGIAGRSVAVVAAPVCHTLISVIENGGGVAKDLYVGGLIITVAEPAT